MRSRTLRKLWHSQSYKSVRFTGESRNSSKVPDLRKTKNSFEINGGFLVQIDRSMSIITLPWTKV